MKISIIIPVYNKIIYLRTVLDQVQCQTFAEFECLLIDDGSTDGSEKICDQYALKDSRFRVFHIPNGGASNARNIGLDNCVGEYITFIDADDQIHQDYLLNLYKCATDSKSPFVIGSIKKIWKNSNKTEVIGQPYQGKYEVKSLLDDFAKVQRTTGIYGYCTAKLVHSSLFENARFNPQIRLAEDLDLYLDIYPKVDSIYFDNKPYYYYLQEAENSSMIDDTKIDYFSQLKIQHKLMLFLRENNVLNGESERITIERIYDYVYFSIFYASEEELNNICNKIRGLDLPLNLKCGNNKMFKRLILFCYGHKLDNLVVTLVRLYRCARTIARR